MLNEQEKEACAQIIGRVLTLLDERLIMERIDRPLERALRQFHPDIPRRITHADFLRLAGELVAWLYQHGLALPRQLPPDRARAEAIWLLMAAHQGSDSNGYDAAWLEAQQIPGGMERVLGQLDLIVKGIERRNYIQWVLESNIRLRNWRTRVSLARYLQETNSCIQRTAYADVPPAMLADDVDEMILDFKASSNEFLQLIWGPAQSVPH